MEVSEAVDLLLVQRAHDAPVNMFVAKVDLSGQDVDEEYLIVNTKVESDSHFFRNYVKPRVNNHCLLRTGGIRTVSEPNSLRKA